MLEVISTGDPQHPDVLFVHGAWHGAWCWNDGFMQRVANAGFHCHAMSLRNHGGSAERGSMRWRTTAEYVEDVRAVAAGLDNPVLVGHSMGGYVLQKLLEHDRPRAVAFVAPVPVSGTLAATWRFARRHPGKYLKVVGTASLGPVVETPALAGDMLLSDPHHPLAESLAARVGDESFLTYLQMMFSRPRPHRVVDKPPAFLAGGTNDRLFSVSEFRNTARAWEAELALIDGLPHDLMLADHWEVVADRLSDWLGQL